MPHYYGKPLDVPLGAAHPGTQRGHATISSQAIGRTGASTREIVRE